MRSTLTQDDLTAIAMLAHDAVSVWAQADEARKRGAHRQAETLEAERHRSIAQIYKILGVDRG
jgi:hypothetical protein